MLIPHTRTIQKTSRPNSSKEENSTSLWAEAEQTFSRKRKMDAVATGDLIFEMRRNGFEFADRRQNSKPSQLGAGRSFSVSSVMDRSHILTR
jgi:hypothetical protein